MLACGVPLIFSKASSGVLASLPGRAPDGPVVSDSSVLVKQRMVCVQEYPAWPASFLNDSALRPPGHPVHHTEFQSLSFPSMELLQWNLPIPWSLAKLAEESLL